MPTPAGTCLLAIGITVAATLNPAVGVLILIGALLWELALPFVG